MTFIPYIAIQLAAAIGARGPNLSNYTVMTRIPLDVESSNVDKVAEGRRAACVRTIHALMLALIGAVCMFASSGPAKAKGNRPTQLANAPRVELQFLPIGNPPFTMRVGGTAQFKLQLINSNNDAITGVHLASTYPSNPQFGGAFVNASSMAIAANTCGGTVTADPGTGTLALSGAVVPGLGVCAMFINVTGTGPGSATLNTGSVLSDNAPPGFAATDGIQIAPDPLLLAPAITKSFTPSAVPFGAIANMTFALQNLNPNDPILGVQINDPYPTGLHNSGSGAQVIADSCGFFVVDVPLGLDWTRLAGGTIPAGGECSVTIRTTASLSVTNVSGDILSANAEPGLSSSADLTLAYEPDLTVTKTHVGNFTQGQTSATYLLTVTNIGADSFSTVTVTDTLPPSMTPTSMDGAGWACDLPTTSCTRSDSLPFGGNFPITLTVDVAANAPASVTNTATVSGGSESNISNDTASDPTTIIQLGGVTPQTIAFTSTSPNNAKVGGAGYQATATATSGLPVTLTIDAASATVCAIDVGFVTFIGPGTCTIDANQVGDATYAPAPQKQQSFLVTDGGGATLQTIAFTSTAPNNATVGGPSYQAAATATSGLPVTLTIDAASVSVCAIDAAKVVTFIGAGNCIIDANQGGNATYAPAPQMQQPFVVTTGGGVTPQTIAFNSAAPNNAAVGGPLYSVTATASSGLPVALTIDVASATVCTINASNVSFIGPGICTIEANQGGDATYAPAPQAPQSFAVSDAGGLTPQNITFTSTMPNNAQVGGATYVATATATSGLPVLLTIDGPSAAVCTIDAGVVTFIGAGSCTIDANQGGDATFAPAPQKQQSFPVAPGGFSLTPQTIAFTSPVPNGAVVAGPGYSATATATSGLPVTLTIDQASAAVCTLNGGIVSFIGAGSCTIDANQGGDATFAPAPQQQRSFAVLSAVGATAQTISFTSVEPVNAKVAGTTYLASAIATSGLPVLLTIDASSATVCKINAGTVTFVGAGTCTIDANQGGNATYAAAPEVQQWFAVAPPGGVTPQSITFTSTAPANAHVAGTSYFATAVATSGLPTVLTIANASATVCTINNGWVSFIGVGTCTINANQGGDATYAPALQMPQSFAVASAGGVTPQAITFTSTPPANAVAGGPSYLATATATSGLPVVLTIDASSTSVCTINYGTVLFTGSGTCKIDANQGGDATYAAAAQVQQPIVVSDGGGGSNHAPVAVDDAIDVTPGGSSNVLVGDATTPSKVLDNDIDLDGDPLSASKLTNPAHGDLTFNANGTFSYQNHPNDPATSDAFTYVACDTHAVCDMGVVTITIGNGLDNHVPFAMDDAIQVASGASTSAVVGDSKATDSVLDNDIDFDGDALDASQLTGPSHGDLTFNADGTFTYQNHSNDPATGDTFLYAACDTSGACASGVVTITIGNQPTDHLPIVVDDAIQVARGQIVQTLIGDPSIPGSVLDNDFDPDPSDAITALKVGSLLNNSGDISLNADGTFTYQNVDQQATSDRILYEACDSYYACTLGVVTISINDDPLDVAPVAVDDSIVVAPNGSTGVLVGGATNVLTNDSDPGDTLTAHLIGAPANGHVALNTDGTFTYYNDDPALGVDSWMYEACDGHGGCTAATVSVTIDNSAPTVTCTLPPQLYVVGDTVSIDLSLVFAPPAGQTLSYSATNIPPSLSVNGSLLSGTLQANDAPPAPPYTYGSTLIATAVSSNVSASENVTFQILPNGEILLRAGFDGAQTVQQPCH